MAGVGNSGRKMSIAPFVPSMTYLDTTPSLWLSEIRWPSPLATDQFRRVVMVAHPERYFPEDLNTYQARNEIIRDRWAKLAFRKHTESQASNARSNAWPQQDGLGRKYGTGGEESVMVTESPSSPL